MKRMIWILALVACKPDVVTTQNLTLPADSASTCLAQCRSIGLDLSSVVIIAQNIGCVCSPAPAPGAPPPATQTSSAAAAAGMTAILIQQTAAAAQTPIGSGVSAGGR
jgi:hypothetical protein